MGQVLHGSATATEAIRRAIQHSQESLRILSKRYGINQKTVPSGRSGIPSPICQPVQESQDRRCCRLRRRRSSSLFAATPCAVEINANPDCFDMNGVHCRMSKEASVKITIATDAARVLELQSAIFSCPVKNLWPTSAA